MVVVMRELALFAGAGGGLLGGRLLGWRTVCAVELDTYAASVLVARQNDGYLDPFPVWDDVRTFDGTMWRGCVDVVSGGFPCQDISPAGGRAGIDGERSGLWREFARIIGEVAPPFVFIENSQHLRTRGLVRVLKDLAALGYDARWGVLGADHTSAPHERRRMWIIANANGCWERTISVDAEVAASQKAGADLKRSDDANPNIQRLSQREEQLDGARRTASERTLGAREPAAKVAVPANAKCEIIRQQQGGVGWKDGQGKTITRGADWWPVDLVQGVDDGVANRVDRVRATGNGQVAGVAAMAWRTLICR